VKKFKFSLGKALKQRQIAADLAIKDLVEAQELLRIETDRILQMNELKEQNLAHRAAMIQETSDWVNQVAQINSFLIGHDLRIKEQNLRLQKAENLVESRREILRQAISEVKILERLEEKQRKEHMQEFLKHEQAEADELSVLRFSRIENPIKGSHEDGI
jgi:flagellar export protein FliJ